MTAEQEAVHEALRERIVALKDPARPLVVGITGIDTAGKTRFALDLVSQLRRRRTPVQIVHVDDFHNPRAYRYAGDSEPDNYYHRSFDVKRLVGEILEPVRADGALHRELSLLDLGSDAYDLRRRYDVGPETIVVVEGVFLLRPEIRPFLDFTILLDLPFGLAPERGRERDVPLLGEAVVRKYHTKYLPAQRRHFAEVDPHAVVDVVVDNSDWRRPALVRD